MPVSNTHKTTGTSLSSRDRLIEYQDQAAASLQMRGFGSSLRDLLVLELPAKPCYSLPLPWKVITMHEHRNERLLRSALEELILDGDFTGALQLGEWIGVDAEDLRLLLRAANYCVSIPSKELPRVTSYAVTSGELLLGTGLAAKLLVESPSEEIVQLRRGSLSLYTAIIKGEIPATSQPYLLERFLKKAGTEMFYGEYRGALQLYLDALQLSPFDLSAMKGAARCRILLEGSIEELELIARFEEEARGDVETSLWFLEEANALKNSEKLQEARTLERMRSKLERDILL